MNRNNRPRRSGAVIMVRLILLLGSLAYIMLLAVLNGSLGFLCAMGVTIFGSLGVAKALGEAIALSYGWIIALIIGCGVLRGVLRFFEQYSNHYIAFRLLAVLRDKIFGALRLLCPAKLESKRKGAIITMITSDIETLEVFYAHTISPRMHCRSGVFPRICACWHCIQLVSCPCGLSGLSYDRYRRAAALILQTQGIRRTLPGGICTLQRFFLDSIKGIRDIVLNNAGEARRVEVNARSDRLLAESKRMKRDIARTGAATELCVSLCVLAALSVGILLVVNGQLSVGRMVIGLVTVFSSFGPIIAISALPGNLTQTFAAGDRVLDLLSETPAVTPVENGEKLTYDRLDVTKLSFSYDEEAQTLRDVCMRAKKGEIIGIVGPSGCGKSTLLKLLLRFWQKDGGEIAYNGVDIDRIDTGSLLDNVTMVSQSTYLFDEMIEENLRIAKPDATREDLEVACKMASFHDFILSLPGGYQTHVGALGDNLSAGERQRIGLARAFLRGRELILLDEPTSNVDSINEGIILKALREQKRKKSILLVSHRESTMTIADRIYRFDGGRIYEQT